MHQTITLTVFNSMSTADQYTALEVYGIYLKVYRLQGNYKIALFEFNRFYVEVWLNQVTDQLTKALAFDDYTLLDPFLKVVDITPLYALL